MCLCICCVLVSKTWFMVCLTKTSKLCDFCLKIYKTYVFLRFRKETLKKNIFAKKLSFLFKINKIYVFNQKSTKNTPLTSKTYYLKQNAHKILQTHRKPTKAIKTTKYQRNFNEIPRTHLSNRRNKIET